ncbi:DUF559 domain-containing protein [Micromonospora sp. WMMD1102]|uniref:endonuclease domain-containing protein n=1 Tax=Micromonospora sp. WMMD1102 TaxID=3016105 RepID=UPI0024153847|nr:DUF559 domain-containing protein [Micromonospora sp. WMMD1102]MDG4789928.1 DUF559 domain-containing protein [Micromonospora sp. WMMD1102]
MSRSTAERRPAARRWAAGGGRRWCGAGELLVVDAGLPPPTAQHEVYDSRGRFVGRVDLAYPGLRIALEYEGHHHRERAHFRQDVSRYNELRAAGWTVLRFTADDVLRHPARLLAQLTQALRERSARPR